VRLKAYLIVNQCVFTPVKAPSFLAGSRVDCVKIAVPAAEIQSAVRVTRGRMDDVAGFKFPSKFTGIGGQGVNVAITTPKKHRAVNHHRTGEENIELIGYRLILRLESVDAFGFEPPFTFGGKFPFG
jgi:hypothetical protein